MDVGRHHRLVDDAHEILAQSVDVGLLRQALAEMG
jgi:hypothetical protein